MKKLIILTLFSGLFFSCKKEINHEMLFDQNKYPQHWKLIEMAENFQSKVTKGTDMPWQESYILDTNGTFIKTRLQDGLTIEGTGSFTIHVDSANVRYIQLKYDTLNNIIGSCYFQEEYLRFEADKLISSWAACDGPGLTYQRTK
jgi:hypothetical protein